MVHDIRTMNFHELGIFLAIARNGGITAAADELGIAKSAVSQNLNRLEQRLQLRLFARSSRRVELTREGERLLPRIESLISEGKQLLAEAEQQTSVPRGVVRIAATPDFGRHINRHLVPVIKRQLPEIQPVIKLSFGIENLQDPGFDFAVRIGGVSDDGLVAQRLGQFRRILVASPTLAAEQPLTHPRELAQRPCLAFSSSGIQRLWQFVDASDTEYRVEINGVAAIDSFNEIAQLAALGRLAAVLEIARCEIPQLLEFKA